MDSNMKHVLVGLAFMLSSMTALANSYTLVDLGQIDAVGVNARGVVIGNGVERGQTWFEGRVRRLPKYSVPYSVNRTKDIVGTHWNNAEPYFWPHNGPEMALTMPDGGNSGAAYGINDSGEIVGRYELQGSVNSCFVNYSPAERSVDFTPNGYTLCSATSVNNVGQVTGVAANANLGVGGAFIWNGINFTLLGVPDGMEGGGEGLSINDRGQVVGWSGYDEEMRAAYWDESGIGLDLDPGDGVNSSEALSINRSGDIVGWTKAYSSADPVAVRFAQSKIIQLGSEVVNLGDFQLQTATAINDKGEIVGDAFSQTEGYVGYILIPIKAD